MRNVNLHIVMLSWIVYNIMENIFALKTNYLVSCVNCGEKMQYRGMVKRM